MCRALYGTRAAGACWRHHLFGCLKKMGFNPSKAYSDVWIRPAQGNSCYEYIAVYVNHLAISSNNPNEIIEDLQLKHYFKLKETGHLMHHLGCRDIVGTLVADPTKYNEKILETYECTFCSKHKLARPPLEESDLDTSELCNDEQIRQYETLIGQ